MELKHELQIARTVTNLGTVTTASMARYKWAVRTARCK